MLENGNLMVIVMNVDFADQKSRKKKVLEILRGGEICLDASASLGFLWKNDLGNMIIFPSAFLVHRGVVCYKKAGRSLDTHH